MEIIVYCYIKLCLITHAIKSKSKGIARATLVFGKAVSLVGSIV